MSRRVDPIFRMVTPILFAHRGGAKEAPESTEAGFRHAIECRTDVFDLDVQLTKDEEMVVWHGPSLDNVRLELEEGANHPRDRFNIQDYTWNELKEGAWVMHPDNNETIQTVPKSKDRQLLTFEEFMQLFPEAKLNVEMKEAFTVAHLDRFISILENNNPDRVGVVLSNRNEQLLEAFCQKTGGRFATNLPLSLLIEDRIAEVFGALHQNLRGRALELPHPVLLAPRKFIQDAKAAGGSCYIFLTAIPLVRALDRDKGTPTAETLFEILDRGVDGIMTDRPAQVRPLLDAWISQNPL